MAISHYNFRADFMVEQMSFLETCRRDDFPVEWDVNDTSARILSRYPCNPDLSGFGITDFYVLVKIRPGGISWDQIRSEFSSVTPVGKDVVLLRRECVSGGVVSSFGLQVPCSIHARVCAAWKFCMVKGVMSL